MENNRTNGVYVVVGWNRMNEFSHEPFNIFPSEEAARKSIETEMNLEYDKFHLYFKPFGYEYYDEKCNVINGLELIETIEKYRDLNF